MEYANPASVGRSMREAASDDERREIVSKFLAHGSKTGNIMTHLAADKQYRKFVHQVMQKDVDLTIQQLMRHSDPLMTALAWVASEDEQLRRPIVEEVVKTLKDSPTGLTVLSRLAATEGWNNVQVNDTFVSSVCKYAPSRDRAVQAKVSVIIASILSLPAVEDDIVAWVDAHASDEHGEGFALAVIAVQVNPGVLARRILSQDEVKSNASATNIWFLEMLSAACADKETRGEIAKNFGEIIDTALKSGSSSEAKLVSSAVRTKLLAGNATDLKSDKVAEELDKLSREFENYILVKGTTGPLLDTAVEGYACTSMLPTVQKRCIPLIPRLSEVIKKLDDAPAVYGALTSLANVTKYPMKDTQEQARLRALQEQAQGGPSPFDVQPKLTVDEVAEIVDAVLNNKIPETLNKIASRLSIASRSQTVILLRNMSCQQGGQRRLALALQGLVVTALYLWISDKPHQTLSPLDKSIAASAIAKVLATVEPQAAFTFKFSPVAVIDALKSQIGSTDSQRPNLDSMEALMALTNMTSVDDDKVRNEVAIKCFPKIELALGLDYVAIQRAALQLVCNLTASPAGAGLFLQHTPKSVSLLTLLAKFLGSEDRDTRLAVSGALAMLSEWDHAPEILGHNGAVIKAISDALPGPKESIDYDLLVRLLTCINTMLKGSMKLQDDEIAEDLIHRGGVAKIDDLVERIDIGKEGAASKQLILETVRLLTLFKVKGHA